MKITMIDRIGLVPYSQLNSGEAFQRVGTGVTLESVFFKGVNEVQWLDGHWMRRGETIDPSERVRPVELVEMVIQTCESDRDEDHEIRE